MGNRIRVVIGIASLVIGGGRAFGITHFEEAKQLPDSKLIEKAKKYDSGAITELGRRRTRSSIKLLERIAREQDKEGSEISQLILSQNLSHLEARIALARMGKDEYFSEFIVGLSSSNQNWESKCLQYLGQIGDRRAVPHLIPILDENTSHTRHGLPPSFGAERALENILPGVAETFAKSYPQSKSLMDGWQKWWKENEKTFR